MSENNLKTNRDRIIDAARDLFGKQGVQAVTMDDVAAAAKVSRATVFNQFGSKHGLMQTITKEVLDRYSEILIETLRDKSTPFNTQIRHMFEIMAVGIEQDRRFYRYVFQEIAKLTVGIVDPGGPGQVARQRAVEELERLVTRGQARGEVTTEINPEDLALLFDSILFGTITHWLYEPDNLGLRERLSAMAEVFIRAAKP